MKKKILSLTLAAAMLTGCGGAEQNNDNKVTTFDYGHGGTYEDGLIYNFGIDQPTSFLDYATMEKTPLCAMPNCTHLTSGCLAQQIGMNPVFYGDYIYYFTTGYGFEDVPEGHQFFMSSKLYKAKLDTSEVEKVVEFTDCIPDDWNCAFVLIGSKLWFMGNDKNDEPTEESLSYHYIPSSDTPGAHFMCSIDLDTGEYVNYGQVCEEFRDSEYWGQSNNAVLKGIYNGKLQIGLEYTINDHAGFDYMTVDPDDIWVEANYEFDPETGECTRTDRLYPAAVTEDTYVGIDLNAGGHHDLYFYHGGEEHVIKDSNMNVFVFDDKAFIIDGKWLDMSDWSEHELPEEVNDFIRCGRYGDSYIFMNSRTEAFKYTIDELLALE